MATKTFEHRSGCPVSCGLDILGDKWSLLVIRDLMLTNRQEFGHFLNAGEGISTNILSDRLLELQNNGLVEKTKHPSHGKKFIYSLTEKGRRLAPVIVELTLWAHENVEGSGLPDYWYEYIVNERETLMEKLSRGEPLFEFDP